jgi:chaperone required for assembly of F1-ATPase
MVRTPALTRWKTRVHVPAHFGAIHLTPSHESRAKRHYLGANVASSPEGFIVELDGRPLRTVAGRPVVLPTEALARLIAEEWNAQKDFIDFETMPATRLARAALDALPAIRGDLARRVVDFADDDLLCYFAETPPKLVRRQQLVWQPILIWVEAELGQPIRRSIGVVHQDKSPTLLAAVEARALALSDLELAGLASAAQLFGSAFLAFALQAGRLSGAAAFAASRIDEVFQAETWGEDAEAACRTGAIEVDAQMLDQWFAALA